MPSTDIHLARGEARETAKEQLAHVKLPVNSNKQYEHDEMIKLVKTVKRVLYETFNEATNGKGMSELLETTPNPVNSVKTTHAVNYVTVLKEAKEDAAKATKAAKAADPNAATIASLVLDVEAARAEADRRNIHSQTIIGTKEGIVEALRKIVGAHIIDKVIMTSDGSDKVSIDDYSLADVIKVAIDHATRPEIDDIKALVIGFYETEFNFQNTINQNMLKLKEVATKIKQFGININEPEMALVLLANVNRAQKTRWGQEFRHTMSQTKKKYTYDHVHDSTSLAHILAECVEADTARNVRDAPAPGGNALGVHKSILLGARSDGSWSSESEFMDDEAYIDSDGVAYYTKAGKRLLDNNSSRRSSTRSSNSSIASSSDSSSAKTTVEVIDCKHCKKWKRTKAHPPKIPVERCMWNAAYVGYRFPNVCKTMDLKYRDKAKYPKGKQDEWKQHKKVEPTKEKKDKT